MKTCRSCLKLLPDDCFYKKPDKIKDKLWENKKKETKHLKSYCKKCWNKQRTELNYRNGSRRPYNKNKLCSVYLGVHIAERLLSNVFVNVERMPFNNSGYDFVCGKEFKVDVKSSCVLHQKRDPNYHYWYFFINKNKTAHYFACIALDNRHSLAPIHFWIFPGVIVNNKTALTISNGTLSKWQQYEQPLDKVLSACNVLRAPPEAT